MTTDRSTRDIMSTLIEWATARSPIRAVLLTSTRAIPDAPLDVLSDYDVILIVQDIQRTALAEQAHVVLPSLTVAEKTGTVTNHAGRVQQVHRAIAPPDEQPSDGEIFSRLLNRVSEARCTFDPVAVLDEIAAAVPAYAGISFARVGAQGWLPAPPVASQGATV